MPGRCPNACSPPVFSVVAKWGTCNVRGKKAYWAIFGQHVSVHVEFAQVSTGRNDLNWDWFPGGLGVEIKM